MITKSVKKRLTSSTCFICLGIGLTEGTRAAIAWWNGPPRLYREPKSAPSNDRDDLCALLDSGFHSAEEAVSGTPPNKPGYFDQVRQALVQSAGRSDWYRLRLLDEMKKSTRLADAGFVLWLSSRMGAKWLDDYALGVAGIIAAKADKS